MIILNNGKATKEELLVPLDPPYGSITDGDWICTRCGEPKVGCYLCAGMTISVRQIR